MSRIDDKRPMPEPGDFPRSATPTRKLSRQKLDRMTRDETYNATSDIFKQENPHCYYCGKQFNRENPEGLETDHIVSGAAGRHVSLLNPETWNNACPECNQKHFQAWAKTAVKLAHVIATIISLRGQAFSKEEDSLIVLHVQRTLEDGKQPYLVFEK